MESATVVIEEQAAMQPLDSSTVTQVPVDEGRAEGHDEEATAISIAAATPPPDLPETGGGGGAQAAMILMVVAAVVAGLAGMTAWERWSTRRIEG
jgi:hypothetical protein